MFLRTIKTNLSVIFWLVICLMGVSIQVNQISSEYFAYEVTTRVELILKKGIEVPTMSFCMLISRLFKWKDMTQEERVSILHDKNGKKRAAYDALNETKSSLDSIEKTLGNISAVDLWYRMLNGFKTTNISRFFELTIDLKPIFIKYLTYIEDENTLKILQTQKSHTSI